MHVIRSIGLAAMLCTPALLLASTADADDEVADLDAPRTTLFAGAGAGVISGTGEAYIPLSLGLVVPLAPWIAADAEAQSGTAPTGEQGTYLARLAAGARLTTIGGRLRPFGALRFVHIHMAPLGEWLDDPLGMLGGANEAIVHRSGLAVSGGATYRLLEASPHWYLAPSAEVFWIALGDGPRFTGSVQIALGWAP